MKTSIFAHNFARIIFGLSLVLLAIKPAWWLVQTWQDAAYDSVGVWAFLLVIALVLWSYTSPLKVSQHHSTQLALILLGSTALLRLAGQSLAINSISALALVVDVYAIALLLQLQHRACSLAPFWLATLFLFALPIERLVQRGLGFVLQDISAQWACTALQTISTQVLCHGTRIEITGQTFLIDLPCSGTNSLVLLAMLTATLMAVIKPSTFKGVQALILLLIAALMSNVLRILLLVGGSVLPLKAWTGIDVMESGWHELTGLIALVPSALLMLYFAMGRKPILASPYQGRNKKKDPISTEFPYLPIPPSLDKGMDGVGFSSLLKNGKTGVGFSLLFLMLTLTIQVLPAKPIDASKTLPLPALPIMLQNTYAQPVALLPKEQDYFTQYGGAASKAIYGERQLLLTSTTSPLRHLHSPDECLRGLGFKVKFLGSLDAPIPSAVYQAITPEGQVWKVAVSFIANDGFVTSNVSEAVWHWLQQPNTQWLGIQRIAPQYTDFASDRQWDQAVLNSFDFPILNRSQGLKP